MTSSVYEDRAAGCLVGLAVGDAYGDLGRRDAYRQRYGIITNLYDDARSTDDTEFAMLTAQTLIDCGGDLTTEHLIASWHKYIISEGGVAERGGKPLYGAVANLERGILPPLSGKDNVQNNDDGAAMRIAPIGIVCAGNPARAAAMAQIESEISHAADGIWAAQAVAASVAVAVDGGRPDDIIQAGLNVIPHDSWLNRAMMRAFGICDAAGNIEDAWEGLHTQLWTPVHSMAAEAIPQAYSIFKLTGGDFRRGMFWAGNFGRDADTIGAVVGALSGAIHGLKAIPPEWVEKVRQPAGVCLRFAARMDIVETALQLTRLRTSRHTSNGT
ncbi:MAG: ADP-ribosylglycohydrolase family protein [Chloroflexi bacterium]|nr:ADP-ribosylglycohydrolase family protein [Chloroflexota bacterium]